MDPTQLNWLSATDAARLVRDGAVSSEELVAACLARVREVDGEVQAWAHLDPEHALAQARILDQMRRAGGVLGPLHGVPVAVKDIIDTTDMPTECGTSIHAGRRPVDDATAVAMLRAAGAVVMGKTNLALLATNWQTNNPIFGRTNNPWDHACTPGGSSGGSGAAVAAGLSPLDVGSDIGGSIRVPAHFCGIYGFKPTEHCVPSTGHIPDWCIPGVTPKGSVRHMGVYGPLARCIEDLRVCHSVLAGPDGHQPEVPPASVAGEPATSSLPQLRVAWTAQFGSAPVCADTRDMIAALATRLQQHGAHVEHIEPPLDYETLWRTWGEIVGAEVAGPMPFALRSMMRMQFLLMMDRSQIRKGMLRGSNMSIRGLARALAYRDTVIRTIDEALERFDVWLCPVTAGPAFTHRKPGSAVAVDDQQVSYFVAVGGYTTPFSLSGHPVVVLPTGRSKQGLPMGVQLVGQRWGDLRLLDIAETVDRVVGDLRHPPGYAS